MPSIDQIRRELQGLHKKVADESRKDSDASAKAAKARERASTVSSDGQRRMKLREAERHEKHALDARKKRADFDSKIATTTTKLHKEESRIAQEQTRSLGALQADLTRRQGQWRSEVLSSLPTPQDVSLEDTKEYDFFISHASPDKEAIAVPLAELLQARGHSVWIDKFEIRVGDSIRQRIDDGLKRSRFGVVILSSSFLEVRPWTERELNGLFVSEEEAGEPRILPIWHNVTKGQVAGYSLILADKAALKSADYTIDEITALLSDRLASQREPDSSI